MWFFQALLMHTNWLTSLKGGGSMKDLASITVSNMPSDGINEVQCIKLYSISIMCTILTRNVTTSQLFRSHFVLFYHLFITYLFFIIMLIFFFFLSDGVEFFVSFQVLDVHDNELTSLPDDIGNCLQSIVVGWVTLILTFNVTVIHSSHSVRRFWILKICVCL